jgi:hypothetical protein
MEECSGLAMTDRWQYGSDIHDSAVPCRIVSYRGEVGILLPFPALFLISFFQVQWSRAYRTAHVRPLFPDRRRPRSPDRGAPYSTRPPDGSATRHSGSLTWLHRTTLIPDTRMLHSSGEENGERDQLTLGSLRLLCAACMLPLPFSFSVGGPIMGMRPHGGVCCGVAQVD